MKRTIIVAACTLALGAAAPAANAATATFKGTCAITGVSTFDPPLTGTTQSIKYDFKSGPPADGATDGTKCSGTLNDVPVTDMPAKATVAGTGDLSCNQGASASPGKGELEFPDGSTFLFDFTFTAIATEVDFTAAYDGAETTGHASFLHYVPPTALFDCSPLGAGLSALGFDATTDEPSAPVRGTKPDPASTGGTEQTSSGTEQTSSGTQTTTTEQTSNAKKRRACIRKAKKKFKHNKKKRKKAIRRCRRRFK